MASAKREAPAENEPGPSKKAKLVNDVPPSSEPERKQRVVLNPADCNLGIGISWLLIEFWWW